MGAFKAYDIRGVYGQDFTKDTVYRIGTFLPGLLQASYVVVGRDVRTSSPEIFQALCDGITDAGCDVWDIGLATTPMVYYSTVHFNAEASVQITASHNPPQYNGLKISRKGAIPVGYDTGLKELEHLVTTQEVKKAAVKGKVIKKDALTPYIAFQKQYVPDVSNLDISIDCSNGMSSILIHDLLGERPHYLYDTLDGTFPHHEPNPLEEKNCKDLEAAVLANHSDVGVIYDGDADRVMFIDERGRFIQPDYITAVIGSELLSKEKGNTLVDIRTSRSTTEYLASLGSNVTIWKVGHAFAKMKIREIHGIFGGELAGHYYFRDFFNCDSGILASMIVLKVVARLKKEGKTFSSFVDSIVKYANSGENNFKLVHKDEAMKALYDAYAPNADRVLDFDGYRIEYKTWWFNVRKSNTEPYLRLVVEAKDKALLDEKFAELSAIIKRFD